MVGLSRATLPGEYFDRTSDQLLVAPEPQYTYAGWFLGAMALSLSTDGMASPGRPLLASTGADYTNVNADRLIMAQGLPSSIIAAKVDFNGAAGSTVKVNRPIYEDTTYTLASRQILTGQSISLNPIGVKSAQNNLTLTTFGGPFSQTNTQVAPFAIESFDANMGVHSMPSIIATHIVRDFHKWLDVVLAAMFDTAAVAVYPEGMTAVADATSVGQFPFTFEQLTRAEMLADTANLPTFPDGYRALVLTPLQLKQLKEDNQYARASEYHPEFNVLYPNYVKSVSKTHIFKSNSLNITNNASSVPIHYGHYLAPGALMAGMGRKPRVEAADDTNYGQNVKLIWLADLAFKVADNRFMLSVRSSA